MSLAAFVPPKSVVSSRGGDVEVRGLTLDDIAVLMRNHLDDVNALVELFERNAGAPTTDNLVSQIVTNAVSLIREAPGLVAMMIAMAADEPDSVDNARAMSMSLQVKVIKAIAELTFEEAGGPKNFIESLMMLLKGMTRPSLTETGSPT